MGIFGFLIGAILLVVPFWFLLPRAGLPSTVALVAITGLGAVVLLWVLAFMKWPDDGMPGSDAKERF